MRLKRFSVALVTAALVVGVTWYWHAAATGFSWDPSQFPPSVDPHELWRQGGTAWAEAQASWRAYRRLHDAIDLVLLHATYVLATAAALSLVGLAGRAAIRAVGKAPAHGASRTVAALRSAPALLGALGMLWVVAGGGGDYLRVVWGSPHPAVRRLREIADARQGLAWPLENGMTTAEVLAAVPDHELTPRGTSEGFAHMLRSLPSGYRDTDSLYWFMPREFEGTLICWLQFRDDKLINFDRQAWDEGLHTFIAGTDPITITGID